jgi:hypothetical protein
VAVLAAIGKQRLRGEVAVLAAVGKQRLSGELAVLAAVGKQRLRGEAAVLERRGSEAMWLDVGVLSGPARLRSRSFEEPLGLKVAAKQRSSVARSSGPSSGPARAGRPAASG